MKRSVVLVLALLLVVGLGCGEPTPPLPPGTVSGLIGPEGGTLVSSDGLMTLSIRPGLVPTPTTFTIAVRDASGYPTADELLGPVYELGPDGHEFAGFVELSMTPTRLPPSDERAVLAGLDTASRVWVPLDGSHEVGDVGATQIAGRTSHFSAYTTFHTAIFDRACPGNSLGAGLNGAGNVTITGATLVRRYGGVNEYWSEWVANSPTITINSPAIFDGRGQYAPIPIDYMPGRTVLSPVGFAITGRRISFTIDARALTAAGFNAVTIDEHCPGNYDVAFSCGPGCMAAAGDGGMSDAGLPPVACQVGTAAVTGTGAAQLWLAVAGSVLLSADSQATVDAFQTWDLTTPTAPVLLDSLTLTQTGPRQIAVRGTTAFVVDGASLVAIDFSNPAAIAEVGRYLTYDDTTLTGLLGSRIGRGIGGVAIVGSDAFVPTVDRGFVVLDVSNPAAMTTRVALSTGSVAPGHIVVEGARAYFVSHMGGPAPDVFGVVIMDITNPGAPARLGGYAVSGGLPTSLAVAGNYLYLGAGNAQYFVVDVTDPAATRLTTAIETNQGVYALAARGSKLYVASNPNDAHLQIYSLLDPSLPVRLTDEGIAASGGAWGVAIGAAHAYVSNANQITVIDLACP